MSRFDTAFGHGADMLLRFNGRQAKSVTYTDPDLGAVPLNAIVGPIDDDERDVPDGITLLARRSVTIHADPTSVHGGVAAPHPRGTFTIDGLVWRIERREAESGSLVRFAVVRPSAIEKSGDGLRARAI